MFTKAVKTKCRARIALMGPSGSGKTYTALAFSRELAGSGPVAVIDTEHGSASRYADLFTFDTHELTVFHPQNYVRAITEAGNANYACLVIDSLSHAWSGPGGALQLVDEASARSRSKNSFSAWRDVTPLHNELIEAMLSCPCHLIVTMRTKTAYEVEQVNGRSVPRKVGLAPVQRDGVEYEFDVAGEMDWEHRLVITKSRFPGLADAVLEKPNGSVLTPFKEWLNSGEDPPAPRQTPPQNAPESTAGQKGAETQHEPETPPAALLERAKSGVAAAVEAQDVDKTVKILEYVKSDARIAGGHSEVRKAMFGALYAMEPANVREMSVQLASRKAITQDELLRTLTALEQETENDRDSDGSQEEEPPY